MLEVLSHHCCRTCARRWHVPATKLSYRRHDVIHHLPKLLLIGDLLAGTALLHEFHHLLQLGTLHGHRIGFKVCQGYSNALIAECISPLLSGRFQAWQRSQGSQSGSFVC